MTADGAGEGKDNAYRVLDGFISKHLQDVSQRLAGQLAFDKRTGDAKERRVTVPLPAVTINGTAVQVEAQIQYRPADAFCRTRFRPGNPLFIADSQHRPLEVRPYHDRAWIGRIGHPKDWRASGRCPVS